MKKILLTFLISLLFLPLITMAESCPGGKWEDNITSDGRNLGKCVCYVSSQTYPNCSGSCGDGRVLSGGECVCPQANQYWNGSTCVTTTDYNASIRDCSSISCQGSGGNSADAYWSDSSSGCVCPVGYSSSSAPTASTTTTTTTTTTNYTPGNAGGSTDFTMPTLSSTGTIPNPISSGSFNDLLQRVINWILNIAMVLAPLVIVYGGFTYMTAMGDTGKVTQGKNIIMYAVIGFILALLAKSLIGIFAGLVVK